jgi:hypothetical protein
MIGRHEELSNNIWYLIYFLGRLGLNYSFYGFQVDEYVCRMGKGSKYEE